MSFDEVRALSLFDGVPDDDLRTMLAASEVVAFEPGDELWHAGAASQFWWVNLEGTLVLTRIAGGEELTVGEFTVPGRWAGGFGAWDEHGSYFATGRATSTGRMLKVPSAALRDLLSGVPLMGHIVEGMFRTARNIEASARQRDALVTLGTLSAGLAHELNNPASAAQRAVDSLEDTMRDALSSLDRLAAGEITSGQFAELNGLRREIGARPLVADPIAVGDREDQLSTWLARHGVDRDWVIAAVLAGHDVDTAWCDRVALVLDGPALQAGFEWVASTLTVASLLGEVKESTRRVSELVAAVKSYSQMDRASMQRVDVTEGLESTMVMLGHKLRDITVVRDYGGHVPQIDAYAGELNQVWTNLIDNAVDAMDGVGTLTISTRADEDTVVVEIADTGTGMTPEVAERAFETFFTTKDVGKGTGLGLDIARRIVQERHAGVITIDSQPGLTVMGVRLPQRSAL
jgi:signal transduction histidine kinase